ncbi:serine/threonine-protein kinase Pink1, mitochondrial-like [Clytia hemisphaerica]|uniref:non-specific serine/threonine protein kinase n=1 Tax=Clytia hemisphaerica TaxID=252671 RepID=A0A7M5TUF0_9CNID|eukprot:TCONS_00007618-protein
MSVARVGRALWRGVQQVIKAGPKSELTGIQKVQHQRQYFWENVAKTFPTENLAANARAQALKTFLRKSGQRIALASFVGFKLADHVETVPSDGMPDLSFLFQAFQGGFQVSKETNNEQSSSTEDYPSQITEYEIKERLGKPSSCGAVYNATHNEKEVAVKMMFNVNTRSDSSVDHVIMKRFQREYQVLNSPNKDLPEHPNIIKMLKVFVDKTIQMEDSLQMYPYMMPKSLFPDGIGRSKTIYLVMPKYSNSLRGYLNENPNLPFKARQNMFCQLLEGVAHLENNNISHRDMKTDNIMIKASSTSDHVELVIIDFGSCYDGRDTNMRLPFQSDYVDRGGNPALMAPEILRAKPGMDVYLDYSKADAWAVGSIAYEIFGMKNPLYVKDPLDKPIPPLRSGDIVTDFVVGKLLTVDCNERFTANDAANLLSLYNNDCPMDWFSPYHELSPLELSRFLLGKAFETHRKPSTPSSKLFETMASRTSIEEIVKSFELLHV